MSTVALFAVGTAVTAIVAAGLALLVYGAVLDGREVRRRRPAVPEAPPIALASDGHRTAA